MTSKLILINTDTHVVVPREPTPEMLDDIKYLDAITDFAMANRYKAMLSKVPQLTTPPVLRWEGDVLKLFEAGLAHVFPVYGVWQPSLLARKTLEHPLFAEGTKDEARRAAEKVLGLPIVEEV